ncbi:hypothetical protein KAX35_01965 [candidate division WOR-3 bacterium]|nr:hypothetical protein [candidate division WOR-3 bacterium]MCK4329208.1 hypothetical protein [candidate division WOR-3 bacterium]
MDIGWLFFRSLGYLIARDNVTIAIAAEQNDQKKYRDITLIPSGSIISISKLVASPSMEFVVLFYC